MKCAPVATRIRRSTSSSTAARFLTLLDSHDYSALAEELSDSRRKVAQAANQAARELEALDVLLGAANRLAMILPSLDQRSSEQIHELDAPVTVLRSLAG